MSRRVEIGLLVAIIVVGFVLRWTGLTWGEGYRPVAITDEIDAYRVGLGFVHGEWPAIYLGQPEDAGVHVAGPLWALCWAGPLLAGGGPTAMTATIIVLNTFGIFLVYLLARKLFSVPVALWAGLFCATAPQAVYYSVGCWNPQVMVVLGAGLYLALWDVMTRPRSAQVFWVMLIPAAMLQFHVFGLFLVPSIGLLVWLRQSELNWRWLVAGAVTGMLLYAPYIAGESLNHWENTRKFLSEDKPFSVASFKSLSAPIIALTNYFAAALGKQFNDYQQLGDVVLGSLVLQLAVNALSLGLAVVFVVHFVRQFIIAMRGNWQSPRRALTVAPALVFVGVLLFVPSLIFIATGRNYNGRYVIGQYPLVFLLPGLFLTQTSLSQHWRRLALVGVVVTVGFNVVLTPAFFRYQGNRIANGENFMPSFRRMEQVRQKLIADAGPTRRVRLDASTFTGNRTHPRTIGAWSLAMYVDVMEQYDPARRAATTMQEYRVLPLANLVDSGRIVVYQGNGIAVVRAPPER